MTNPAAYCTTLGRLFCFCSVHSDDGQSPGQAYDACPAATTHFAASPEAQFQSLPFGDGFLTADPNACNTGGDDATPLHFTGKERDQESGNDYFGARYYASTMGRFLSPDYDDSGETPEPVPYAALDNPQTLNLYGYGQNNPLLLTDPNGHVPCSGVATVTITVTPSGSSMSQSADDCPTSVDLLMSSFPHLQIPTQKPPQSTQIDEMRPMSAPVGTMDANTTIKEDYCAKQAALAVGKNAIAYDLMSKLADKATDAFDNWEGLNYPNVGGGSSGSSLPSSPGESVVNGVDKAASFVATNSAAQQFVRAALRSEGVKVSARAVGSTAGVVGKYAGAAGTAYTIVDAVRAFQACMAQ